MVSRIGLITFTLLICACSTHVLRPDLLDQTTRKPQFEDYYDRWLFGIIGDSHLNPKQACLKQTPVKYKEYTSFEDTLLGIISLGIYLPETVQVWCVSYQDKVKN